MKVANDTNDSIKKSYICCCSFIPNTSHVCAPRPPSLITQTADAHVGLSASPYATTPTKQVVDAVDEFVDWEKRKCNLTVHNLPELSDSALITERMD